VRTLLLFAFAFSLYAKQTLSPLQEKLYTFIKQNQIQAHPINRYIGTWPSYPKYSGVRKEIPESNSFMTLQTLILLHQIDQDYELPGLDKVVASANRQILHYADDAKQTDEPAGTVAFWPLIQTDEGKWIRSFDTQWYNTTMRILDVGNDFDTSSQAFVWFYLSGQKKILFEWVC
jgi:hypothetical protein